MPPTESVRIEPKAPPAPTSVSLVESIAGLPPAATPEMVATPDTTLDAQDVFPGLDLPVIPDPDVTMPTGAPHEPEFGPLMPTLEESRKEYADAVREMEGRFKGVRSLSSLPGMRKSNLLKGIEYVSEHKDGRTESLEEQLRQKGVHEKDIDIAAQIVRAREMHISTRTHEAQRMIADREQVLRTNGKTEDEITEEIAAFKRGELFDKLIADENEKLQRLRVEGWPPKKKSLLMTAVNTWSGMSKTKRIAFSTLLFTGVAFGAGAFATTGAIGAGVFAGGKALRSVGAGVLGKMTSELAGKAYDATRGKKNIEASAKERITSREKLAVDTGAVYDALRSVLAQADKDYQSSVDRLSKNRRNKAIIKGVTGVMVAGGAGLLQGAFDTEPTAEVASAETGVAPKSVSVRAEISDAPDPKVTAAVAHESNLPAEAQPSGPEQIKETMISIRENGNVWNSAKILGEHHGLDKKAFAEAWANSKVTLPNGQEVPLAELDLVHENDTLSYVVGEDGKPGHFEFKNTSNIEYGDVLPGEEKPAVMMDEDADAVPQKEKPLSDGVMPAERGLETPQEALERKEEPWRQRSAEAAQEIPPESYERKMQEEWREPSGERVTPPLLEAGTAAFANAVENNMQLRLAQVYEGNPSWQAEWNAWKVYSVREMLNMGTENLPESGVKLRQYVESLIKDTGTRPRFRLFGKESIGEFIARAEENRLALSLKQR
jgi:hypothetical protein